MRQVAAEVWVGCVDMVTFVSHSLSCACVYLKVVAWQKKLSPTTL